MAYLWFTDEWAVACGQAIDSSDDYRAAAGKWEWPLSLVLKTDNGDRGVYLDLYQGDCRAARAASMDDLEAAEYVIEADAPTWKQVLTGDLDPIMGIMSGKLKLAKGNVATLAGYVKAAKEMVVAAATVETEFSTD